MPGPVAALDGLLAAHRPGSLREEASLRRTRAMLRWLRDPFDEHADPTHVTGSAIVVAADGRIALHRHKRLGLWLQPGGHLDPGETPAQAALREAVEETGLPVTHPSGDPWMVHVDVHQGPRGHVHLDVRYLLTCPAGASFAPHDGESIDVAWFPVDDACAVGDDSLANAVVAATDAAATLGLIPGSAPASR